MSKKKLIIYFISIILVLILIAVIFYSVNNNKAGSDKEEHNLTQEIQTPSPTQNDKYYQDILSNLSDTNAIIQPTLLPGEGSTFYTAYNLGGKELVIDNHLWKEGSTNREEFQFDGVKLIDDYSGLTFADTINDPLRVEMIKDFIWHGGKPLARIKMNNISNGKYWVFLYVYEDTQSTNMDIYLNKKIVAKDLASGSKGTWSKFGPFAVDVNEGNVEMISTGGDVNFSGIELYRLENRF